MSNNPIENSVNNLFKTCNQCTFLRRCLEITPLTPEKPPSNKNNARHILDQE